MISGIVLELLLSLIQDKRFAGMPPTIHVEESSIYPDWDIHYIVTFKAGYWDLKKPLPPTMGSPLADSRRADMTLLGSMRDLVDIEYSTRRERTARTRLKLSGMPQ